MEGESFLCISLPKQSSPFDFIDMLKIRRSLFFSPFISNLSSHILILANNSQEDSIKGILSIFSLSKELSIRLSNYERVHRVPRLHLY